MGIPEVDSSELLDRLNRALRARQAQIQVSEPQALRLFNGHTEGYPNLSVELFGRTLVVYNYARPPDDGHTEITQAIAFYRDQLPLIQAVVLKSKFSPVHSERKGKLVFGTQFDCKIQENGIWYAIDLMMNQDASFYLDTRYLRKWALENLTGKQVLNTFAYTGSLGVAALASGASQVLQLDLNRHFLSLAQASYALNGLPYQASDFLAGDFFTWISRLKRTGKLFDCVFLDPPFFSITDRGRVDLENESHRLINKVRPLVAQNGRLVAINNALFTSGEAYYHTLQRLCADGYLEIERLIPVPEDVTGYPQTIVSCLPADPAPFNHATKIAVLRVTQRKS